MVLGPRPPEHSRKVGHAKEVEGLTGAILNRLTHRVHILEADGESYRLRDSKRRLKGRKG